MKERIVHAADLFCGAGGTTTGLRLACDRLGHKLSMLALNHWKVAVATHRTNHPDVQHICESIDSVDPRKAIPGGYLDILMAPQSALFSQWREVASLARISRGRPRGTCCAGATR